MKPPFCAFYRATLRGVVVNEKRAEEFVPSVSLITYPKGSSGNGGERDTVVTADTVLRELRFKRSGCVHRTR